MTTTEKINTLMTELAKLVVQDMTETVGVRNADNEPEEAMSVRDWYQSIKDSDEPTWWCTDLTNAVEKLIPVETTS